MQDVIENKKAQGLIISLETSTMPGMPDIARDGRIFLLEERGDKKEAPRQETSPYLQK